MSLASHNIQSVKLQGHHGAVLCLDHNSTGGGGPGSNKITEGCLLSGSEDGTARLWDLRASPRSVTCIVAGEEVTSVAFGQPSPSPTESAGISEFSRDFTVYLSLGCSVLAYDLRKADGPVIRESTEKLLEAEDDVNQVVISKRKRDGTTFLAAADDSGVVQVLDGINGPRKGKGYRYCALRHGKDGLVTTCVFRPRSKNFELASGGTDCQVCLWDVNKPKRALSSRRITIDQGSAQMCNPPMVHSLAWSPSGRLLASGLGDGTSSIWLVENRSLVEVARLQDPNGDTPVAAVIFPSFLPTPTKQQHATSQDRLLALIRNDGVINMWDLGFSVAGDKAINPSPPLLPLLDENLESSDDSKIKESLEELALAVEQPKLLFKVPHHEKPNWMASSCSSERHFPSSIFVADTTSDITAYSIPLVFDN